MKTKQERAQSMVIFGVALLGLLAFIALATDGGRLYVERRNAQSAADSAALAAARVKVKNGTDADSITAGRAIAASNGFNNDGTTNTVSIYITTTSSSVGNEYNVKAVIASTFKTSFMQLFARKAISNQSEAVVKALNNQPILGPNLIVGANPTACDTVSYNGNVNVHLTGGNILSNSNADVNDTENCNSMSNSGSGGGSGGIYATDGHIYMVGTYGKPHQEVINPTDVDPDPEQVEPQTFASLPMPDCNINSNFDPTDPTQVDNQGDNQGDAKFTGNKPAYTLYPGRYRNISVQSNPIVTLSPGLYCLTGDFKINAGASLIGNGVVIVMRGGIIDFSGASSITLKSPAAAGNIPFNRTAVTGGVIDYRGIIIYADPTKYNPNETGASAKGFILNGSSTVTSESGTIYLPTANCTVNGGGTTVAFDTQLICNTVSFGGSGTINFTLTKSINQPGSASISLIK